MAHYELDPKTGKGTLEWLNEMVEFPVVSPLRATQPSRYIYAAKMLEVGKGRPGFNGVAKIDTTKAGEDKVVAVAEYGPDMIGGEGVFVPRCEKESDLQGEDDGYIVAYAHHLKSDTSYLVIFRATDMKLQAKVLIPQRIPMGFHGQWINASQLKAQMA